MDICDSLIYAGFVSVNLPRRGKFPECRSHHGKEKERFCHFYKKILVNLSLLIYEISFYVGSTQRHAYKNP